MAALTSLVNRIGRKGAEGMWGYNTIFDGTARWVYIEEMCSRACLNFCFQNQFCLYIQRIETDKESEKLRTA